MQVKLNFGPVGSKKEPVRERFKKEFIFSQESENLLQFDSIIEDSEYSQVDDTLGEDQNNLNCIQLYFHYAYQNEQIPAEIEYFMKNYIQKLLADVYGFVNTYYLHRHLNSLKTIMIWVEKNAPSAYIFKYDNLDTKEDKYSMIYEDKAAETLSIPKKFSSFLYYMIPLWNLRIWIRAAALPAWLHLMFVNLVTLVTQLDEDCPVFYKFYQSLKLNRSDCQISEEQYAEVEEYLNDVSEKIVSFVKGSERLMKNIEFKHLFGNVIKHSRRASNFAYMKKNNKIHCEFMVPSIEGEIVTRMSPWNWKYITLIKILLLVYNTKLYVHVFGLTTSDEFDGTGDLFEIFQRTCENLIDDE